MDVAKDPVERYKELLSVSASPPEKMSPLTAAQARPLLQIALASGDSPAAKAEAASTAWRWRYWEAPACSARSCW